MVRGREGCGGEVGGEGVCRWGAVTRLGGAGGRGVVGGGSGGRVVGGMWIRRRRGVSIPTCKIFIFDSQSDFASGSLIKKIHYESYAKGVDIGDEETLQYQLLHCLEAGL